MPGHSGFPSNRKESAWPTEQRFKDEAHEWLLVGEELHTNPRLCELPVSLLSEGLGRPGVSNREVALVCFTVLQSLLAMTSTTVLPLAKIKNDLHSINL